MANKAISELPQAQNVNNQDLFVLEQSGIAKKLTAETFITEQGIIDALAEALDGHGGIQSVTLSSVSGRIRTYRITFTDQSATTFQVYDGTSIERISRTSSSGLDDVYTVFLSDGTTTFFTVHNGADGTVSEAMLNDALKDKAPAVTETTESSAIANFTDGADDMPLHNILAEINPVQNLNGYDNPWPAGGGANVLPITASTTTVSGVTFTVNKDESNNIISITTSGTASGAIVFQCSTGQNINGVDKKLTGCPSGGSDSTYYMTARISGAWSSVHDNGSGLALYGTIDTVAIVVASGVNMNGKTFLPMIAANTVTTFAPYSNICPITGHTEVNVTRTGKNIAEFTHGKGIDTSGHIHNIANRSATVTPIKIDNTRQYKYVNSNGNAGIYAVWNGDTLVRRIAGFNSGAVMDTSGGDSLYVCGYSGDADVLPETCGVFFADQYEGFEPYQGNTVTVDWQTEAGTVYGGTIDVATGLLTVDRVKITFDGTQTVGNANWRPMTNSVGWLYALSQTPGIDSTTITNNNFDSCKLLSDSLKTARYSGTDNIYATDAPAISIVGGSVYGIVMRVNDTSLTTAAAINAWLAEHPINVVYPLATPQTYQLTPQEVKTLLGTNNVWADTGNVSVTYPADTKMYIQNLTQPTEDDMTANQAITSGKFFMVGNNLYLATAAIASGAKIIEGTNATRLSLADALNRL